VINASISGSAMYLNGKPDTSFAQLDGNGKISVSNIPDMKYFDTGTYTGDGTQLRTISLSFTPRLVKVYTTNNTTDDSLFIPSVNGGFKYNNNTNHLQLVGNVDNTPSVSYGKLTTNGFIVSGDSSLFGNKSSVIYYWEAFL
jgi:hypothetical protein